MMKTIDHTGEDYVRYQGASWMADTDNITPNT